ncbi:MAG: hypothetical protein ACTHM2_20590 [Afipia sp.]|jgi:hypothetical protein
MTVHHPVASNDEHRVLRFRPRTLARAPRRGSAAAGLPGSIAHGPEGLARYAQGKETAEDYRHRMLTNAAAAAFAVVLTLIGIWLAMRLADLRETQDCVLMGRRDCAHINTSTATIKMSSSLFRE